MRARPPLPRAPAARANARSTWNPPPAGFWQAVGASIVAGGAVMALVLYALYRFLTNT